jgi:hypothetical protein
MIITRRGTCTGPSHSSVHGPPGNGATAVMPGSQPGMTAVARFD